jgi:hypothetical protein
MPNKLVHRMVGLTADQCIQIAQVLAVIVIIQAPVGVAIVRAQYQQAIDPVQFDRLANRQQDLAVRMEALDHMDIPTRLAVLDNKYDNIAKDLDLLIKLIYGTLFTVVAGVFVHLLDMRSRKSGR